MTRILFPPHPEVMDKMCQQGFHDALRFLQRHNKISCTRCIAIQSAYSVENDEEGNDELIDEQEDDDKDVFSVDGEEDESQLVEEVEQLNVKGGLIKKRLDKLTNSLEQLINYGLDERMEKNEEAADDQEMEQQVQKLVDLNKRIHVESREPARKRTGQRHGHACSSRHHINRGKCGECVNLKNQIICNHPLPGNVADAIQEACDKVNKGLINYIFKFRIVKIMSTLSLPYVLPFDITLVLINKLRKLLPLLGRELANSLRRVVQRILKLLSKMNSKDDVSETCLANFRYQVAVTEFDYSNEQTTPTKEQRSLSRKVSSVSCATPELSYEGRSNDRKTLEKSYSFKVSRNRSNEDLSRIPTRIHSVDGRHRSQRKSYAGSEQFLSKGGQERKVSMMDVLGCKPSERVLSKMNLGFSMDLNDIANMQSRGEAITSPVVQAPTTAQSVAPSPSLTTLPFSTVLNSTPDVVESSLGVVLPPVSYNAEAILAESYVKSNSDRLALAATVPSFLSNASTSNEKTSNDSAADDPNEQVIQIANQALNKGIDDLSEAEPKLGRLKEITNSKEALMAFHYKGADNVVKVTEIFNFSNEDAEERRLQSDLSSTEQEAEDHLNEEEGEERLARLGGGKHFVEDSNKSFFSSFSGSSFDVFSPVEKEEAEEGAETQLLFSRRGSVPASLDSWASDDSLDLSKDEQESDSEDTKKISKRQRKTNYIVRQ